MTQSLDAEGAHYIFSVYYHNSSLDVKVGAARPRRAAVISRVGNTGRATNDHLHLEVHAAPTDDVHFIVDSLERYPDYTTNPELWIQPLPGTGIVAGRCSDAAGRAGGAGAGLRHRQAEPAETPYSYAETYGDKNHPHPLYGEHFAVGDVPPGDLRDGRGDRRKARCSASVYGGGGKLTWVVFRP